MAGELHSFVHAEPVVLDPVRLNPIVETQHRSSGADPINLAPLPTLVVYHRRMAAPVRINVTDLDPDRHDLIEGRSSQ
jgi:hypothetical protein